MVAQAQAVTTLERDSLSQKLMALARTDTAVFCKLWRNGISPASHQYDMAERADNLAMSYQADFWPRDHGKSEIFAIGHPLRRICEDPDIRILIVQKTRDEATKTLSVIKEELEHNSALKAYYRRHWHDTVGHLDISNATGRVNRDGEKEGAWQKQRIYCKRSRVGKDPTVEAVGIGGAITGGHFDIIILDDIEDDESIKTADRRKGVVNWFSGTILQLREPQTKIIIVGTLKTNAKDDLYNSVRSNPIWNCKVVPAILSHKMEEIEYEEVWDAEAEHIIDVVIHTRHIQTLWPEKWGPKALILEYLASPSRSIWIREKMNDLRAVAGRLFKQEWFCYYPRAGELWLSLLDNFDRLIQVWDTAYEADAEADWSACLTLGLKRNRVYLLDLVKGKWNFPNLLRETKEQYTKWGPEAVYIEDKSSGKSLIQVLETETTLPIRRVDPGGKGKVDRARSITVYYESKRVYHPAKVAWLLGFEDDLVLFPEGANDDVVDILVYGLKQLFIGGSYAPQAYHGLAT